jgi:hypothetical protein
MEDKWVKVYSDSNSLRAQIVCDQLIMSDIEAVVLDKTDSSYHTFGEAEVHVREADKQRALPIVAGINWNE